VPVYLADLQFKGEFEFAALQPLLDRPGVTYLWHESRLRLPVSEVRSLREVSEANFAGQTVKLGPAQPGLYRGVEARVDLTEHAKTASAAFEFHAVTAGSRGLSLLPLGSTTTLRMHSNWPHPSFYGAFLPAERTITQRFIDALQIRTPGMEQKVVNLSGGNQQKVVLAKWLALNPKLLIVDEPTRGIDVGAKAEVHLLLSRLAQQGVGILMISSELPEILGMSDRILVMREGRIAGELSRAEATQEAIMSLATGLEHVRAAATDQIDIADLSAEQKGIG